MSTVQVERRSAVSVVTVDNPPVNALSVGVPRAIMDAVIAAGDDPTVTAVILCGAGRGFIAGADIRRLGSPWPDGEATLRDVISAFDVSGKPIVAAMHGNALGGGLELAMACHYRVCTPATRLGQPEVKLGFPPGAGGTQRLPRLVGMDKALDMIVTGDPIDGREALSVGLVDRVVDDDLIDGALQFVAEHVTHQTSHQRTRDRTVPDFAPDAFDRYRKQIARRARGRRAPYACIDCLEAAVTLPFSEGIKRERSIFEECVVSDESRALRYVFFAERAVWKIPGLSGTTVTREVNTAAIIGAGTMGTGIAMNFANAGIPVKLLDQDQSSLDRARQQIEKNYAASVSKGRLSPSQKDSRLQLISPVLEFEGIANADIVIEAVFEELPIKLEVFEQLDRVCRPATILASNTSYLDVNALAAATQRPAQVLGLHFFSPAHVMRLLEVVRTDRVSDETLATVFALARRLNKIAVLSGVCHGFIGNRMLEGYLREAAFLIEEGALPQQVDRVMTDFGFPMGPFAVSDLAGLDIGWRKRKAQRATNPLPTRYAGIVADRLCEQGRLGQKTGAGYYRYESGNRTPVPDPAVETLIVAVSNELGLERRAIDDSEILQRCLYPLINEGARILDEKIALRPDDIDVVWINGYGFPAHRGGPMFYADIVGPALVYETICGFRDTLGEWWGPAPLLKQLAINGGRFQDLPRTDR